MSVTSAEFARPHRWVFPLAIVAAVALVATVFPFANLWNQQQQFDATASQIAALHHESLNIARASRAESSRAAAIALAREQYQLVQPGQSLIQVLPGDGSGYVSASTGDPGLKPLVSPVTAELNGSSVPATQHRSPGFWSRFARTLEFWR